MVRIASTTGFWWMITIKSVEHMVQSIEYYINTIFVFIGLSVLDSDPKIVGLLILYRMGKRRVVLGMVVHFMLPADSEQQLK